MQMTDAMQSSCAFDKVKCLISDMVARLEKGGRGGRYSQGILRQRAG